MPQPIRHLSAAGVLQTAERLCRRRVLRFTALRRRVLEIVCKSRRPSKAYDILYKLGGNAQPPTVYRALDFLQTHGFLHEIKSRRAYIACGHPQKSHACYFLLCSICGRGEECCNGRLDAAIAKTAAADDFLPRNVVVEIEGVCRGCHKHHKNS